MNVHKLQRISAWPALTDTRKTVMNTRALAPCSANNNMLDFQDHLPLKFTTTWRKKTFKIVSRQVVSQKVKFYLIGALRWFPSYVLQVGP